MARYLVDANVLSGATKPGPDPGVLEWLERNEREIAADPIILGEIRFGILLLPRGRRRTRLEHWFEGGVAAAPPRALTHDLVIATLNRRDFEAAGVALVSPTGGQE